jgi:Erv1 / Alr family
MTRTQKNRNSNNKTRKQRTFTKKDFSSGDGFVTSTWGAPFWHVLHTISFNYPVNPTKEDKINYRDFILSLKNVLPCKYCRMNLKNNFKQRPLTMSCMKNRESFSRYVYSLHELINKMLDKKSNLSYCDVRERYEHFRSRCTANDNPKVFDFKKAKTMKKKEKGCTEPLYGKKSKCVINIVPQEDKTETFKIAKECIKTRGKIEDTGG